VGPFVMWRSPELTCSVLGGRRPRRRDQLFGDDPQVRRHVGAPHVVPDDRALAGVVELAGRAGARHRDRDSVGAASEPRI